MKNFTFQSPTKFVFGRDTHRKAGQLVAALGAKKVMVLYGGGSAIQNGTLPVVLQSLDEAGLDYVSAGGVQPNPVSSFVYSAIEGARDEGVDFMLAVGGGSVIDTAKAVALGVPYPGDFLDFYRGKKVEEALPIGVVLTIPAAGSEGSPNTVITDESTHIKKGAAGECLRPKFAVLNPELTFTLSKYQSACGISDMMAHIFERYFTKTPENVVTDRLCEGLLLAIKDVAMRIIIDSEDYEAQAALMWAGMLAHNNLCGVGRDQDWGSHALAHQISALYDAAHGAALAVIFPAWMKYVYTEDIDMFARIAHNVWGVPESVNKEQMALDGIAVYEDFLRGIGMPTKLSQLDVPEDGIPEMVELAFALGNQTIGSFKRMTPTDVEAVYRLAL
ncbi:MAG TPA: iron-containing alcohol dehydrogenase [Candidatus Avidehalobacter gallistercoris]|uniref:Iron-containing alcohol dehydrogenase n=1 Tax=Candidatus Avidehalobacter gallistercoris TaxID=2840694 RepID=A0A9D1HKT5_9FIRM|nr:iron-containing alcohol dehydrogenase [Candidatus Avidehalobacter gallistercoris]